MQKFQNSNILVLTIAQSLPNKLFSTPNCYGNPANYQLQHLDYMFKNKLKCQLVTAPVTAVRF